MRVDDVPPWLAPAFHAYGFGVAGLLQACMTMIRRTCSIERSTQNDQAEPRIECIWHEHLPAYIATYLPAKGERRYVWMNHPIWYMRPVHLILTWNGVEELALGSTGHGGQAALERVVALVRAGASTALAVDGPAGPAHKLKRGALDMARASGAPIVAIRFAYSRALRGPGWDHKWWPAPGSRIRITESAPIFVSTESYDASRARVSSELG